MLKRVLTALLIILLVIPPLYYGGILLSILIGIIVAFGSYELIKLLDGYDKIPKWVIVIFEVLLLISTFNVYPIKDSFFISIGLWFAILPIAILFLLSLPVFKIGVSAKNSFQLIGIFTIFFTLANVFIFIYNINPYLIYFIIFVTYLTDTGAYLVGRFLGKHPLNKAISPHKTVEGAIGGYLFGLITGIIFMLVCFERTVLSLVIASIVLPIISQLGDLAFSAIKREHNIKDFSNVFPGHGGFLDRVDSLAYNLIGFNIILIAVFLYYLVVR